MYKKFTVGMRAQSVSKGLVPDDDGGFHAGLSKAQHIVILSKHIQPDAGRVGRRFVKKGLSHPGFNLPDILVSPHNRILRRVHRNPGCCFFLPCNA